MFGVPGAKGVVSSPPQTWIKFNDSPTPLESPLAHQQPLSHNQSSSSTSYHQQQQTNQPQPQPQQQSKVSSSLSPSLSDNFSPNENSNNISNGIQLANFDFNAASIEKDPKILHPVALRVSPDGLTNLPPGVDKKGAFTVYRKTHKDHSSTIKESTTPSSTKESNKWLEILKAKYHPPKPVQMPRSIYDLLQNKELVDYIQDLQERCYRLETMNNELIHKMADLMEDQF